MARRFKHEDVSAVPAGWKVRTVTHGDHRVRVAFPPGRRQRGSGRLVSVLHPMAENTSCSMRSSNPAELLIMGANPPRKVVTQTKLEKQKIARERAAAIKAARLNAQNAGSVYSKAVSMGYPYARGDGKTASDDRTRLSRFTKDSEGSGPAVYVGWDHETKKWVIEHGRNPGEHESNPRVEVVHSENPPVETIVEEFTGQDAEWIDVYNEPHIPRGRYAQLGKLIALYIKPTKGGQVIRIGAPEAVRARFPEYWDGRPPVIVSDRSARQIYFVDGCQDIMGMLSEFATPAGIREGTVLLGDCRRIDYQCRKEHVADPEEDLWKHTHGEENGALPRVFFDTRAKRLLYQGGDYRIEGAWIKN